MASLVNEAFNMDNANVENLGVLALDLRNRRDLRDKVVAAALMHDVLSVLRAAKQS